MTTTGGKVTSKLYNSKRWKATRERILLRDLYNCQMPGCGVGLTTGRTHPRAAVVDHKTPHNGDPELFWCPDEGLQSTCKKCHDRVKQAIERRGYSDQIGVDGFPVDKHHPWYAGTQKRWGYSIPHGIEPSGIPVTLVCGPPASGKSTYVEANSKPGDTVIDFDVIRRKVGGVKWDQDASVNRRAFAYRDRVLRGLKDKRKGRCWLIVMAPARAERDNWCRALGSVTIHVMDTPRAVCVERVKADPDRQQQAALMIREIDRWFTDFVGATRGKYGAAL
jgi:predicted kinase